MPAAQRGLDARGGVLHDHAVARLEPHARGGVQEQVGRRLAVRDVGRAEDAARRRSGRRARSSPSVEAHLLVVAARRDAGRRRRSASSAASIPRTGRSSRSNAASRRGVVALGEVLGHRAGRAAPRSARRPHAPARPMNAVDRLLAVMGSPRSVSVPRQRRVGERLGVDEHAVAVEDHEHRRRTLEAVMRSLNEPWTLGGVPIPNRVVLAPLAGIGNWFVRLQAKRYGAGLACREMVSSFAIHYEQPPHARRAAAHRPSASARAGRSRSSCSARTPT